MPHLQIREPAADGAGGGIVLWNNLVTGTAVLTPTETLNVTAVFTVAGPCASGE